MKFAKITSVLTVAAVAVALTQSAFAGPPKGKVVPGKPGDANIVETAIAANAELEVFDTLLAAATCDYFDGAVVDILTGDDKVTLFAPVDTAFEKLGLNDANVCAAFEEDPNGLLTILAYHVTEGRRFSNSVFNKRGNAKEIEMLLGTGFITTEDGMIEDAQGQEIDVVAPFININASNGVIHVIDTVLLP